MAKTGNKHGRPIKKLGSARPIITRPGSGGRPTLVAPRPVPKVAPGKTVLSAIKARARNYFAVLQEEDAFVFAPSILEGGGGGGGTTTATWPAYVSGATAAAAAAASTSMDLSSMSTLLKAKTPILSVTAPSAGGWDFSAFGAAASAAATETILDPASKSSPTPAQAWAQSALGSATAVAAAIQRAHHGDEELRKTAERTDVSHKKRVRLMSIMRRGDAYASRVESKVARRDAARKRRNKASW